MKKCEVNLSPFSNYNVHWWCLLQWNTFLILQKVTNLLIVMIIMFSIFVAFCSFGVVRFSWIRILTLKHTTPSYWGYHSNYWWPFWSFCHVITLIAWFLSVAYWGKTLSSPWTVDGFFFSGRFFCSGRRTSPF